MFFATLVMHLMTQQQHARCLFRVSGFYYISEFLDVSLRLPYIGRYFPFIQFCYHLRNLSNGINDADIVAATGDENVISVVVLFVSKKSTHLFLVLNIFGRQLVCERREVLCLKIYTSKCHQNNLPKCLKKMPEVPVCYFYNFYCDQTSKYQEVTYQENSLSIQLHAQLYCT